MPAVEVETRGDVERLRAGAEGSLRELDTLDFRALAGIAERHATAGRKSYLDLATYLAIHHKLARRMGLDRSSPLQILDLAAGPCHFGFVCRFFGHRCIGLDKPKRPLLPEVAAWLGVEFVAAELRAGRPLPKTPRVDLVTALRASFHQKTRCVLWTLDEWALFLDDLRRNHLKPDGRMHLMMNRQDACDGPHVYDPEFASFIAARGGTVTDGGTIRLRIPVRQVAS